MKGNGKSTAAGALILMAGGLIGVGMALLYAPQTGKKTRRQLMRYADRTKNEAGTMLREITEGINESVEDLTEWTSDLMGKGSEATEDWKKYLVEAIERSEKNLDKQKQKLLKIIR